MMKLLLVLGLLAVNVFGQITAHTRGAALPSTPCAEGAQFHKTGGPAGGNDYSCTATAWVLTGSTASTGAPPTGAAGGGLSGTYPNPALNITASPCTAGSFVSAVSTSGAFTCGVPAGGGATTPALRGTGLQVSSASSYTVTWPAGTLAGDLGVIFTGSGFSITVPTGWTVIDSQVGANLNGVTFYRVLNSTDIATGNVVVAATGLFSSAVGIVTFVGVPQGIENTNFGLRTFVSFRSAAATTSITLVTDGSPVITTDFAVYFGAHRGTGTDSVSLGANQRQANDGVVSACIFAGTVASAGGISPVYTYPTYGASPGNYSIVAVFRSK